MQMACVCMAINAVVSLQNKKYFVFRLAVSNFCLCFSQSNHNMLFNFVRNNFIRLIVLATRM